MHRYKRRVMFLSATREILHGLKAAQDDESDKMQKFVAMTCLAKSRSRLTAIFLCALFIPPFADAWQGDKPGEVNVQIIVVESSTRSGTDPATAQERSRFCDAGKAKIH